MEKKPPFSSGSLIELDEYRVLVTGGRAYTDKACVWRTLDEVDRARRIDKLIEGGAEGADRFAHEWWVERRGTKPWTFEAKWDQQGPAAGPIRNKRMLNIAKPHLVLAFPGYIGTPHMCMIAAQRGVEVRKVGWQ